LSMLLGQSLEAKIRGKRILDILKDLGWRNYLTRKL
jgi:hypothetical protein